MGSKSILPVTVKNNPSFSIGRRKIIVPSQFIEKNQYKQKKNPSKFIYFGHADLRTSTFKSLKIHIIKKLYILNFGPGLFNHNAPFLTLFYS